MAKRSKPAEWTPIEIWGLVIGIIAGIVGIIAGALTIVVYSSQLHDLIWPPPNPQAELLEFDDAKTCMSDSCALDSCLQTFANKFPNSNRVASLRVLANVTAKSARCQPIPDRTPSTSPIQPPDVSVTSPAPTPPVASHSDTQPAPISVPPASGIGASGQQASISIQPPQKEDASPRIRSDQGFNAATKTRLPIAVLAPQGGNQYEDQYAANRLAEILSGNLNIVPNKSAAILYIEISNVHTAGDITRNNCTDPQGLRKAVWSGSASMKVELVWSDGKIELPSEEFRIDGVPSRCDQAGDQDEESQASGAALEAALTKVKDKIVTLANR